MTDTDGRDDMTTYKKIKYDGGECAVEYAVKAGGLGSAKGDASHPIYLDASGTPQVCNDDLALNSAVVHNTGNEIIDGQKTFRNGPLRIQNPNHLADWNTFYVVDSYMGTDLYTGVDQNYGGLRLTWDNTIKKITVEVFKIVNGQFSSNTIANL